MSQFDWRSPQAYDRTATLETPGLAWEYLRRHPDYHRDFQAVAGKDPDPMSITTFRKRWGLSFRG
jgi:hypothetical protein